MPSATCPAQQVRERHAAQSTQQHALVVIGPEDVERGPVKHVRCHPPSATGCCCHRVCEVAGLEHGAAQGSQDAKGSACTQGTYTALDGTIRYIMYGKMDDMR